MRVYAVIGGMNYEGVNFQSLRLFDCKSSAEAYKKYLEGVWYDFVIIDIKDVCMETT